MIFITVEEIMVSFTSWTSLTLLNRYDVTEFKFSLS